MDGAWNNLILWKLSLPMAEELIFKVPFKPNYSLIL